MSTSSTSSARFPGNFCCIDPLGSIHMCVFLMWPSLPQDEGGISITMTAQLVPPECVRCQFQAEATFATVTVGSGLCCDDLNFMFTADCCWMVGCSNSLIHLIRQRIALCFCHCFLASVMLNMGKICLQKVGSLMGDP